LKKDLDVALIGFGTMGRNHARVLQEIPRTNLVAICDLKNFDTPERGITPLSSVDEVIEISPDYCVVATPTSTHEHIVTTLMRHKIPVLIEKPISNSLESSVAIKNAADDFGSIAGVGYIERFNPALINLFARLQNRELGTIFEISTKRMGPPSNRILDVGVVMDLATHDIDLVMWLMQSSFRSIFAQTKKRSGITHEETVTFLGTLENGVITSHSVNWLSPIKERSLTILGEHGTFVADLLKSELVRFSHSEPNIKQSALAHFAGSSRGEIINYAFEKEEPLLLEHLEFQKMVRGDVSRIASISDGIENMQVIEAILKSSELEQVVFL
jgi:UDP-N-acetylglucosamine 3-dehydrogenase